MVLIFRVRRLLFFFFLLLVIGPLPSFGQQRVAGVVASDNELAAGAGLEILQRGGNAVDAAVATAFALGVVDPASSGIGGGGFMVIYQIKEKKAHALDFRETAPAAAHRDLYIKGGKPVPSLALTGALAVAVPGEVAGLAEALKRFGSLPLATVMAPAIRYAEEGFLVRPYLRSAIERQLPAMRKFSALARVFLTGEGVPAEGERIRQPELGETLKAIAAEGAGIFYQGRVAEAIAETMKREGGVLTLDDLKNYRPVWREPLIGRYRKRLVVTMPPPSSGGIALLQILNILEGFKLNVFQHNSATYLHLIAETLKHAFADRAQHLGDPDFVQVPVQKLSSREYAAWLRSQISSVRTHPASVYGLASFKPEKGGTTHLSVIDRAGNAVSCTLTINTQFGSKLMVPGTGVILNNEIDDFSIQQGSPNVYRLIGNDANAIQPKKRPLSSMAPTIILQGERPVLVVGASGGPRIISATLQAILNVLDFQMPVRKAIEAPRIHHQWMPNEIVVEREISDITRRSLERRGHAVREGNSLGVVQAILAVGATTAGEADPRKEERSRSE